MEYLFIYGLQIAVVFKILAVLFTALAIITLYALYDSFKQIEHTLIDYSDLFFRRYRRERCKKDLGKYRVFQKVQTKILITSLSLSIFCFLLPTKQTLLLMGGTYYGKKAISTVASSEKLEKVNKIIDLQLDKYIKELNNDN